MSLYKLNQRVVFGADQQHYSKQGLWFSLCCTLVLSWLQLPERLTYLANPTSGKKVVSAAGQEGGGQGKGCSLAGLWQS